MLSKIEKSGEYDKESSKEWLMNTDSDVLFFVATGCVCGHYVFHDQDRWYHDFGYEWTGPLANSLFLDLSNTKSTTVNNGRNSG